MHGLVIFTTTSSAKEKWHNNSVGSTQDEWSGIDSTITSPKRRLWESSAPLKEPDKPKVIASGVFSVVLEGNDNNPAADREPSHATVVQKSSRPCKGPR